MNQPLSTGRRHTVYVSVLLSMTVAAILLRFLNLAFFFDASINYYRPDSFLPVLEWMVLTVGAVFSIAYSFFSLRKEPKTVENQQPRLVKVFSVVAAVGFLFLSVSTIGSTGPSLATLLSLGACLYFLSFLASQTKPLLLTLSGLCVIVRLMLVLAQSYFDMTVPMNSPGKLILELACLSAMLFFVEELRAILSKARPTLYPFSLGITVLLTGTASIPALIGHYANVIDVSGGLSAHVMLLTLFLYALCRFLLLTLRAPAEKSPVEVVEAEQESLEESTEEAPQESDPQV